jgi:glycosyltransferase involved in cell wall biosynthesis
MLKILLSAYACEPGKGSEPGVGWHWVQELAQSGCELWVLTRENNRAAIERELNKNPLSSVHFVFYDLPEKWRRWKKGVHGVHLYYFLWQIGAFLKARGLARTIAFNWVHHVTFVGIHQPSFMGLLGIPFIFGPVAGGETTPWRLRQGYSIKGHFMEWLRDAWNIVSRFDPLLWLTFFTAKHIVVTSVQTRALVPVPFRKKCTVHLAIGSNMESVDVAPLQLNSSGFRILFAGNLLDLKGVHLALEAFALLQAKQPASRFTIVGRGPREERLKALSHKLGLDGAVDWKPWMSQAELNELYGGQDVFLFPSLRDSGGLVVLEAMATGLPVIALDLGGPGFMVDKTCGFRIETTERDTASVIGAMAESLQRLSSDPALYTQLSLGAMERASQLSWKNQIKSLYQSLSIL